MVRPSRERSHDRPRQKTDDDFGWEAPVNLGASVNSPANDAGPTFFEDAVPGVGELLFASNRPGTFGLRDLWVSQRETLNDGWMAPADLGSGINTPSGSGFRR